MVGRDKKVPSEGPRDIFQVERPVKKLQPRGAVAAIWLRSPLSAGPAIAVALGAVAIFVVLSVTVGGPNAADSNVSTYFAWTVSHAHFACAYVNPRNQGGTAAPLYPLISSGFAAVLRIGHGVPFPNSAVLGRHCASAIPAIYKWSVTSKALTTTLWIGYVGWLVLAFGVLRLIRTVSRRPRRGEAITLLLVSWAPPVMMCLVDFFHPQDLLAFGLVLLSLSFVTRQRWMVAGLLLGLAVLAQQFAWLAVVALVIVTKKTARSQLVAGLAISIGVVAAPLLWLTSGRAWESIVYGTGGSSWSQSLLVQTGLRGNSLYLVARLTPLLMTAITASWMRSRYRDEILRPVPLISLIAVSMLWRLVFEINVWGYYFMAVTVMLLVLAAVSGRLRLGIVAWVIVVSLASADAEMVQRPWYDPIPMWVWQGIMLIWAFALVINALRATPAGESTR
jgi:hypothetical protein